MSNKNKSSIPSIIASDLSIIGDLVCEGSIEIEGRIQGNINCSEITIRKTGIVTGDVKAKLIQVDGEVSGLLEGADVIVSETGRVSGMIRYQSLSIKDGAYIDGQCKSVENIQIDSVESITLPQNAISEVFGDNDVKDAANNK